MEKRYTLPVAIALVVGTVIGSGVFFKAEAVLTKTGGNLSVGILAFIIMGVVMIISACTFGVVAQSHEGVEGLVGYAAASCGKTYSYYVGWFMAVIYYPSLVSVLSWLPARYFGVLMGWDDPVVGGRTMMLAGVFMVVTYTMNALAPKLAGKLNIGAFRPAGFHISGYDQVDCGADHSQNDEDNEDVDEIKTRLLSVVCHSLSRFPAEILRMPSDRRRRPECFGFNNKIVRIPRRCFLP